MKKFLVLVATFAFLALLSGCGTPASPTAVSDTNVAPAITPVTAQTSMLGGSDLAFLQMMIPHHQEAIEDSQMILAKSKNEELKHLAQNIVDGQTAEVKQMQAWMQQWFGVANSQGNSMKMMGDLSKLSGDALDQAYIKGMVTHHQLAITMAQELKTFTKRTELLTLADNILKQQSAEISILKRMQTPTK